MGWSLVGRGGAGHLQEREAREDVREGGGLVHGGVFSILKAFCKIFSWKTCRKIELIKNINIIHE